MSYYYYPGIIHIQSSTGTDIKCFEFFDRSDVLENHISVDKIPCTLTLEKNTVIKIEEEVAISCVGSSTELPSEARSHECITGVNSIKPISGYKTRKWCLSTSRPAGKPKKSLLLLAHMYDKCEMYEEKYGNDWYKFKNNKRITCLWESENSKAFRRDFLFHIFPTTRGFNFEVPYTTFRCNIDHSEDAHLVKLPRRSKNIKKKPAEKP